MSPRVILLAFAISLTAEAAEPAFTPVRLSVSRDFPDEASDFRPNQFEKGIVVDIHVAMEGIVSIDKRASSITAFTDDTGKDLTMAQDGTPAAKIGFFAKIKDDGSAALFSIQTSELPGKGAHSVTMTGFVVVDSGLAKGRSLTAGVPMVKGSHIGWGSKHFVIGEAKREGSLSLTLETDADVSDIISLSVIDATGGKSVAKLLGSSRMDSGSERHSTLFYEIDARANTLNVLVEYWKDLKATKIPFTVVAELGPK